MAWLYLALILFFLGNRSAFAAAEADLLVGYDLSHANAVGGSDNVEVRAANAIASSNLINELSGTGARVRIVGYKQSAAYNYQRTSNGGFVQRLSSGEAGWVEDVKAAATAKGADLVTYVCESNNDGAGAVAAQPGRESSFDPSAFFSTVIAHELGGHNYGCDHRDGLENPKTILLHNYCGGGAQGWYSNYNTWVNGVRLIGGDSCLGAGPNSGDNSRLIGNNAQGVADRSARLSVSPRLGNVVRRWSFNQAAASAPAGTTVTDSVTGTEAATVEGTGATFTGNGLRLPGGASGSGAAYIKLPSDVLSTYTNVTIEIWARPLSAQTWARVADFNNGTSNYLTLTSAIGADLTAQRFESKVGGATVTLDSDLPTTAGVQYLYTITYTSTGASTGRWQWYRNGEAVARLDVAYPLATLQDVNNWLGRSVYGADNLANCEYAEVRVSNVAMSSDEVLANYELGPNRAATDVFLTADDPLGSASFNSAGRWNDGLPPVAGKSYETYNFRLRTPADGTSRTFSGQALKLTGGSLTWKGTANNTITVNDLTLAGTSELTQVGAGTWTLAGNLRVDADSAMARAAEGPINLTANLSGKGQLLCIDQTVTLAGSNVAFTGKVAVGDGRTSSLAIDSEARLGSNPASLVSSQLTFNRGTLETSGTFALDDPNRGILFAANGGTFNVASGTLTIACPLYSPALGSSVTVGKITKDGPGTLVLNSTGGNFDGMVFIDTGSSSSNDGVVRVMNNQVLANAHSPIYISNTNSGTSQLQLDGTSGSIILTRISLAGRFGGTPAIQNLAGTNNIGGVTVTSGGSNYIIQSDSGLLNFTSGLYSEVTGNRTFTFQGNGNIATLSTVSELTADSVSVVKLGSGTLTLAGTCSHDGTTTLTGGTLRLNGSITTTTGTTSTAAGTTFAGTGTTSSPTTMGGIHAPGNSTNSTGTQTFSGPLTYSAAAKLNWTLANNGTTSSKVAAQNVTVSSGAAIQLIMNGPESTVDFTNGYWTQPHSWNVLTATAVSGQFTLGSVSNDSAGNSAASYGTFSLQQSATGVAIVYYPLYATPPPAPVGLSGTGFQNNVKLAWTAAPDLNYNVRRATIPGGPYELIATGLTTAAFTDTSAVNGTTYYYVITAVNVFGESEPSAEIVAMPHLPMTIDKANNTTALNQATSWVNGFVPNLYDTARWSGLPGTNSVVLGANMALGGLTIGTTGGAVNIGAGNILTLGTKGIDMSAASQPLTIAAGLTLGAGEQTWNVATGRALSVSGAIVRNGGSSLVIDRSVNSGTVTASPALVNGIVGPWATVKSAGSAAANSPNGRTYATVTGGNIVPFTGATASGFTWTNTNDNTFNYDVNATTGSPGFSRVANTVRYTGAAATQNYGVTNTTTTQTLNGLMNAGTGTLTISEPGGTSLGRLIVGSNNGNELDLIAASAGITVSIPIQNDGTTPGSLLVAGPGIVSLSGVSTYSGGTILASGELHLTGSSTPTTGTVTSGPIGTGTLTLNGGALVGRSGGTQTLANPVTVNLDVSLNTNVGATANNTLLRLSGPVNLGGNTRTLSVTAAGGAEISGVISNGGLRKAGDQTTLHLSNANTYAGGTMLIGGTLRITNASGLGAATGSLTVDGGTLDLNGLSPTVGTLQGGGGVITSKVNGTSTLTTDSSPSSTFAGALQNGAAGQVLALTKNGAGILTLTGTSNYSGATTISAGALLVNGALTGNSPVTVSDGAAFGGTGTSSGPVNVLTGGRISPGTAATAGVLTISGPLTLGNGTELNLDLAATNASDRLQLGSALSATGVTTINVAALDGFGSGVYPLITGAANIQAANFALGTTPAGYTYELNASGGTLSLTVAAPLAPPTGLTATGLNSSIALSWTAVAGADSYTVKRSATSGSGYETIATSLVATNYTDPELTGGTAYYYVVTAVNLSGPSDDSSEASATALTPTDAWRQLKFGTTNNTGDAADEADPDFDGLTNLTEYALGSDPLAALPSAGPQVEITDGKLTITFTRNTAATDVTLSVVAADNPEGPWTEIARSVDGGAFTDNINGTPTGAVVSEIGAGAVISVQVSDVNPVSANPKRFLRLEVRP